VAKNYFFLKKKNKFFLNTAAYHNLRVNVQQNFEFAYSINCLKILTCSPHIMAFQCGYCHVGSFENQVLLSAHCMLHMKDLVHHFIDKELTCPVCHLRVPNFEHCIMEHRNVCFWCMTAKPLSPAMHPECLTMLDEIEKMLRVAHWWMS